ncbi:MAG: inorganic diphosphatase [Candidatus Dependentiae bacterium]|nr:inorganic diphosphatase [Candidatus Dependentiae bacterium]
MSFAHITIGKNAPELINVVVEIPRGSRNKYEYNEELDVITLDRVLHSPFFFPTDYGFVPHTRSEDGDHLDILVLITQPAFPGCVIQVRPIGVLDLEDEAGRDWKIIAVADKDPYYKTINNIDDVNIHLKREIKHFFETYKQLEDNKMTKVRGWESKEKAYAVIKEAQERYKDNK